ncbi:DUF6624 domain-containing protein [Spirosoma flavum]|uniref:DUF6624 domain-containing protein n=1 Tax=Spirosoma flavum TaxID=2048557 RepID=A0ABW6AL30_9BACT
MRVFIFFLLFLTIPDCYAQKQSIDSLQIYQAVKGQLLTINQDDQQGRQLLDSISRKYGAKSNQVDSLWKAIHVADQVNLEKIKVIFRQYGWIGEDKVGVQASMTQFLVIQHSDVATQHQFLPIMRQAAKAKKADAGLLAMLEDRVALGERKMQIYGSQISLDPNGAYVMPLVDPDNVDKRRAEVGLGPLADYISRWHLKWDVNAYKAQLPELKKKHGIDN